MKPNDIIPLFDNYLIKHKEVFSAVIIGGAALSIMGIIKRETQDCIQLNPSRDELLEALSWVKQQDQNPKWPDHVEKSLQELAKEIGYEL